MKTNNRKVLQKPRHISVRRAVKNSVVPHKGNGYRPHLIRGYGIGAIIVVAFIMQMAYSMVQTGSVLGQTTDITREQLLSLTNKARAEYGEGPLQLNNALSTAATLKAKDMLSKHYWSHVSPTGVEPWHWFEVANYSYSFAGENLAKDFRTTDGVITAWMNSPEHRQNILNDRYADVGFAVLPGVLEGKQTMLVVALYGKPAASNALVASPTSDTHVLAATDGSVNLIERLGIGIQSLTPAVVGSIVLFCLTAAVALLAHAYRRYLPKELRQSWRRHHGLYKAVGMASLVVILITLYGGGQI